MTYNDLDAVIIEVKNSLNINDDIRELWNNYSKYAEKLHKEQRSYHYSTLAPQGQKAALTRKFNKLTSAIEAEGLDVAQTVAKLTQE